MSRITYVALVRFINVEGVFFLVSRYAQDLLISTHTEIMYIQGYLLLVKLCAGKNIKKRVMSLFQFI